LISLKTLPQKHRDTEEYSFCKRGLWGWHFFLFLLFYCVLPGILHAAGPLCLRCHPAHYAKRGRCTACHRGNEQAARQTLAHHELIPGSLASFSLPDSPARERGKKLAALLACRRCHALEHRGNRLASDLEQVANTNSVAQLGTALQKPAWYMPDFRLTDHDRDDLLTYLLFAGNVRREGKLPEIPLVVHFADDQRQRLDPFNRHCGGCHMTLTARHGGLGQGRVAPNLAGLLGAFYPRTYRTGAPWTPAALKQWLQNPRTSRPLATMLPVRLSESEYTELLQQITETAN